MNPYYADDWLTVWQGDCREVMAQMEPDSVHCVVTSPPYWGLRDYGIGGQLGLEPTPEEYVENMVAVFREVRRVLRKDGTCWVNLGDSYATGAGSVGDRPGGGKQGDNWKGTMTSPKPKDLVGIPWRVAFTLQADGWYLRSDIIWSKPNPMPESVTDRPTKAHEYLFLLSKSARYYYDADAVREGFADDRMGNRGKYRATYANDPRAGGKMSGRTDGSWNEDGSSAGRNLRSVWSIATQPYPGAHFATFPEKLVEPCVKAGTSERGVCPECGAPWRRVTETTTVAYSRSRRNSGNGDRNDSEDGRTTRETRTLSWIRSCRHDLPPVPATVLDPFAGSGTTGRVAQRLGRRAVMVDLSGEYLVQAMKRNTEIPLGLESA